MADNTQTGRTFRMLLEAVTAASYGRRVLVRACSDEEARDLCRKAAKIADGYFLRRSAHTMSFGSGGEVRFTGPMLVEPPNYTIRLCDHAEVRI